VVTLTTGYTLDLSRSTGKSTFQNVSQLLLYVYHCQLGRTVRVPLFGLATQSFYWSYDNSGLRLAQLRFYPKVSTTVASGDTVC
jgi:hypothetical protein